MKNRSENSAGRGQILSILQVNSRSIDQKSGEIWTGQANLQPISFKSDRLLAGVAAIYSLRITQSRRATAFRDGDSIRLLTIAPDYDSTY